MYKLKAVDVILQRLREPRKRIQVVAGPRQVGKTTSVEQALAEYRGKYTYKLAEGLGLSPLDWLITEWNAARIKAKTDGEHLLVIDEIHKIKGWSGVIKRLWDEDNFNHVELKVCLLGSSRLLLQKGLDESLAGRFEMIDIWHWSFADMHAAFGYSLEEYILFGGYPGAADLRDDEIRWKQYVRDAIIEPSITLDILQLETVAKPELLRQTFVLGCNYSGKILSYQKMVGQLQEAGNTTTIAHYLRLLGEAGLLTGLDKLYDEPVRVRASSPKLAVCNNALRTTMQTGTPSELRADPVRWGHAVESAVGAQLMSSVRRKDIDLLYWNVGCKEVDYVLRRDNEIAAIEVNSTDADSVSGMREFRRKYPRSKAYLVGGQGMSLEEAFSVSATDLL